MDNRTVSVGQTPLYHEIYSSITSCRLNGRARHKVNGLQWVCLFIIVLWAVAWSFFSSGFFLLQPQAPPTPPPPQPVPPTSSLRRNRRRHLYCRYCTVEFHPLFVVVSRLEWRAHDLKIFTNSCWPRFDPPNHWLRDRLGWQETCAAAGRTHSASAQPTPLPAAAATPFKLRQW